MTDKLSCGHPADGISFDRSICGVCGQMHYFCDECGAQADACDVGPPAPGEGEPEDGYPNPEVGMTC